MKVIYHIDVQDKLSPFIWKVLCNNFNCKIEKMCHFDCGEEFNIYLTITHKGNPIE